jgi:hypothetical protein
MINRSLLLLLLLGFFMATCSVDRDPCLLPKTTSLRVGTYKIDTSGAAVDSVLPSPLWVPLTADSLQGILYSSTAKFSLSLSSVTDSCRYILQPDTSVFSSDTLTFFYDRTLHFLSNACGYNYYFHLKTVRTTLHNIDSVKLTNTEVNSDANSAEHVQIFF